jgi:hypothetical protein
VVILVTKGAPVARNWKTSKRYAVLMTTLTDQKKATDSVQQLDGYISDATPVRTMLEMNPDEPELIKKLSEAPRSWENNMKIWTTRIFLTTTCFPGLHPCPYQRAYRW